MMEGALEHNRLTFITFTSLTIKAKRELGVLGKNNDTRQK